MPRRDEERSSRRTALSELIQSETITRQDELVARLNQMGFDVTQSSVSRDLAALGVGKIAGAYALPPARDFGFPGLVSGIPAGDNLLVIKTEVAAANLVAARLDGNNFPEVVGTLAGDDTVFVATTSRDAQRQLLRRLGLPIS
jgi:transcriptional regulator of arginine metabolism